MSDNLQHLRRKSTVGHRLRILRTGVIVVPSSTTRVLTVAGVRALVARLQPGERVRWGLELCEVLAHAGGGR